MSRRQARSDAVLAVTVTVFAAGVTGLFGDRFSPVDQPVDR